jgi:tetratricopeptide (TPR) repeat protein
MGGQSPMTRLVTSFTVLVLLLPAPARAQQSVLTQGLTDLTRAMMSLSDSRAEVDAAIDRMAAGLEGWNPGNPPPDANTLLGDEAAAIPVLPLAAYADAFARLRRGEYRDAIVSLRRAAGATSDERSQLAAVARLAQEERHVEAERMLRALLAEFPDSGVARWWLGRISENLNRIAEAREAYEAVVPMALTGRAAILAAIGRLSHLEGQFVRATEAFEQRLRLMPNDPAAHKDLAWVHIAQDRTEAALAALGTVVTMSPRDAEAHVAIGRIHLDAGRHDEAIAALRRALDLRPALHEARYALALALKRAGRDDEAAHEMALFERAQREATEGRRRTMAVEAQRQEEMRQAPAK